MEKLAEVLKLYKANLPSGGKENIIMRGLWTFHEKYKNQDPGPTQKELLAHFFSNPD